MPPNMPAPLYPWQPQPFWPFYYKWWPLTRWSTHGLSVHVMRFCSSVMLGHDGLLWGAISLSLSSSPLQLISTGSSSALLEPSKSSNQIPKIPNHQATTNNFLRKTAKDMTILWRRKGEKKNAGIFFPQRSTEHDTKTSQVAPEQDEALFECMDPEPCRLVFNFIRNCFWHNSMAPKNRTMENQMLFQTSCTFILHIFPYFPISIPLCYLRKSSV